MKIAIVGTGIAGNVAAYRLRREHDITVYEARDRIGGHTNTIEVEEAGRTLAVDTGFIVYNDATYPNFLALLDELGVASQPSDMSFSVTGGRLGLEYNGSNLNTLFAQRRNLVRPSFYRMLADILRFNRSAPALLEQPDTALTLGDYLDSNGYSEQFVDYYILPMGSAIWSTTAERMRAMTTFVLIVIGGTFAGTALGGILADRLGYRPVFAVSVGLIAIAALLAWRLLSGQRGRHSTDTGVFAWRDVGAVLRQPRPMALLAGVLGAHE